MTPSTFQISPVSVTLTIIALMTPTLAWMVSEGLEARQIRKQTTELSQMLQTSLSQQARQSGTQISGIDPALSQHLELVHRSATKHRIRLENLYREAPALNAIRLGLGGGFWETNSMLRDLEHAGFGVSEFDLSSDDALQTIPNVQSRILIETPNGPVSGAMTDFEEETPYWRNPFSRLRPHRVEVEGKFYWGLNDIHSLTGIASINGIETATIDGRDFVEGEVLGGRKITRIEPHRVWLSDEARSFVLEFAAPSNAG